MNRNILPLAGSLLLSVFVILGIYGAWYSYNRNTSIEQYERCEEEMKNPKEAIAPDGTLTPIYSIENCILTVTPPPLWDLVRGRMTFEGVPDGMIVDSYSIKNVLLGRYSLKLLDLPGCDQSATTSDCLAVPPVSQEQPYVPPNPVSPTEVWVSATSTPILLAGFSFELPGGWRGSVYNFPHSQRLSVLIQNESSTRSFGVECPPTGKGLEGATRLLSEARDFTASGVDYSAIFEKWAASGNNPWYLLWITAPQSGDSLRGSRHTYCLVHGSATPDIEEAMRMMYASWK